MKWVYPLLIWTLVGCHSIAQKEIKQFPKLIDCIDPIYAKTENIIPIAAIKLTINSKPYTIPIFYTMFDNNIDSSTFLLQGENIDHYSYKLLESGKFSPLFKKEALVLPTDHAFYLKETIHKIDSVRNLVNLNDLLKFSPEPEWWQDDETPLMQDGSPMKFICQIELGSLTMDDCCLFIFFDPKRKLVKYIYQRD